jgi:hypothetical protein
LWRSVVRDDPSQSNAFKESKVWEDQRYQEIFLVPPSSTQVPVDVAKQSRKFVSNSLSSNERNRMFFRQGENFADVTLVSGTDDLADGRSFGLLDFDQDGWTDIALMTLNAPRFKLYKNQLQTQFPDRRSLRIQLTGGQVSAVSSGELSNRDGIGAKVLIQFESGQSVMLQKQAGEGFASQNSETLSLGCPADDSVAAIEVRWPSGKTTLLDNPDITEVIHIHEVEDLSNQD